MALSLILVGCEGDDGDDGPPGPPGPPGSSQIDLATADNAFLEGLDIESEITDVRIASPPEVDFTLQTADGRPVVGLEELWNDSNRFVRFTITKLVPGIDGDPDSWVAYTRDTTGDGSTEPDYDTGSSLVATGDGNYTFTFNTDVNDVSGVPYEPALTHRVAGQIGSGSVALEPQNPAYDFVPAGGEVENTRNIAVMESCNECHDGLVFHGRRFEVEYCVNCHNPDLAQGEGNFSFMVHRIHSAGSFAVLDDAIDYSEVTYPQDLQNCRKCHNGEDEATAEGSNWQEVPNIAACVGCHSDVNFETGEGHGGGAQADNSGCVACHVGETSLSPITTAHLTANATLNNPDLLEGQRDIRYELLEVTVDEATGQPTIDFRITSDGTPLDVTALPADLAGPGRYPGFLMAWSLDSDAEAVPVDPGESVEVTSSVSANEDDAEEFTETNEVFLNGGLLDLNEDTNSGATQYVGMRFPGVDIPQGATIVSANVQFTAAATDDVTTSLTISGEATDDAPTFTDTAGDISNRLNTSASVAWAPEAWTEGESGLAQQTPELSSVIQEIVNRGGWAEGQALAIIITGTEGTRSAVSFDNNPVAAPTLHVTYTTDGGEPGEPVAPSDTADFNNLANPSTAFNAGSQPISVGLGDLVAGTAGSLSCDGDACTAILDDVFPAGATHRTIGLQGYFQQEIGEDTVALHTPSVTMAATADDARREVVDSAKCSNCHEWFEGHGGNRVIGFDTGVDICTMCHVPNLSSSGRSINPADAASRPDTGEPSSATVDLGTSDTSIWPEDTNNLKDMIHGIHSADFRMFDYEFVRGRNDGIYYNWSEVTFPAENGTGNCLLCHLEGTNELPLDENVLPTTVRTTQAEDGLDADFTAVATARDNVPNPQDWVNSPTASTCYYCHDNSAALAHMVQNGGSISIADPDAGQFTQRHELEDEGPVETCTICHGPGKQADVGEAHPISEVRVQEPEEPDDGEEPAGLTPDAGDDQTIEATGTEVQLDAGGSTGPEGATLTYNWTLTDPDGVDASDALLSDRTIVNPTFTPDAEGVWTAEVEVSDGTSTATDSVTVTVGGEAAGPDGAQLYADGGCANCHGDSGEGGIGPNLQALTAAELQAAPAGTEAHTTANDWTLEEAQAVADFL